MGDLQREAFLRAWLEEGRRRVRGPLVLEEIGPRWTPDSSLAAFIAGKGACSLTWSWTEGDRLTVDDPRAGEPEAVLPDPATLPPGAVLIMSRGHTADAAREEDRNPGGTRLDARPADPRA